MQPTVYLVSNAVHMYAVYILFTAVLGKSKLHQFAEILTYIVYYLINCGVYLFMDNIMLNLISNILPMFVIMLQYKKPIQTYIFLTIGVCAVGMILDWMMFCIFPESMLLKSNTPQSIAFLGFVFLFRHDSPPLLFLKFRVKCIAQTITEQVKCKNHYTEDYRRNDQSVSISVHTA